MQLRQRRFSIDFYSSLLAWDQLLAVPDSPSEMAVIGLMSKTDSWQADFTGIKPFTRRCVEHYAEQ